MVEDYTREDARAIAIGTERGFDLIQNLVRKDLSQAFTGLKTFGPTQLGVVSSTASLTLASSTHSGKVILMDCTASNVTATVPAASTDRVGENYAIVVSASGSDGILISLAGTEVLNSNAAGKGIKITGPAGDMSHVVTDGINWYTIAQIGTWTAEA